MVGRGPWCVKNGKRGPLYKHLSDFLWMKLVVLAILLLA
jgi:hypothetical protein